MCTTSALLGKNMLITVINHGLYEEMRIESPNGDTRTLFGRQLKEGFEENAGFVLEAFEQFGLSRFDSRPAVVRARRRQRMTTANKELQAAGFTPAQSMTLAKLVVRSRGYGTADWSRTGLNAILSMSDIVKDRTIMGDLYQMRNALGVFRRTGNTAFDPNVHLVSHVAFNIARNSMALGATMRRIEDVASRQSSPMLTYIVDILLNAHSELEELARIIKNQTPDYTKPGTELLEILKSAIELPPELLGAKEESAPSNVPDDKSVLNDAATDSGSVQNDEATPEQLAELVDKFSGR